MELTIAREGRTVIARLGGRIDGMTQAGALEQSIREATEKGDAGLILECSDVSFVSSAGLRMFAMVANRTRQARAAFAVCGLNAQNRQVFEISGFEQLLTVVEDIDEARWHIASAD